MVRVDWQHVVLAVVSGLFILALCWIAMRVGQPQLWHVISIGAAAWVTTIAALFKTSVTAKTDPAMMKKPEEKKP